MKKLSFTLLIIFFVELANMFAQTEQMVCTPTGTENVWNGQIGGYALPSEGTINVLFVFAQFQHRQFRDQV